MRQRVNQSFADIDVELKRRHDLIPNLVETVKGYAAHEAGTLEKVIQARNSAVAAQTPDQKVAAENALSGTLRQLFALTESYPNLKANENFQQLQAELTDIENKIAASRRFFNNSVGEYNTGIQQFPAGLFAAIFGFTQRQFFDLGDDFRKNGRAGPAGEVPERINVSRMRCSAQRCTAEPGPHATWVPVLQRIAEFTLGPRVARTRGRCAAPGTPSAE